MKRLQPFTIGTKLSVPVESKCPECADIHLSAPATDSCRQRNNQQHRLPKDCSDPQPQGQTQQEDVISPVEDFQEDQTLDSPSSPSRSIKKIAICASGEIQEESCSTLQRQSQRSVNNDNNNINSKNGTTPVEQADQGECEDNVCQMKNEQRPRLQARDPKGACVVPTCSPQHSDGTAQTQQWELKDFENSLIQLTASLDFKEEDPQDKHELNDINLEKLPESEGMDELNKPWLRLRALLRNYQKDLMLALDVSSFYQQADNLIKTINSERQSLSLPNNQGGCVDADLGEIAIQIRMLAESASRLSDLHPTLATRVRRKQAEVKHSWARLQDTLRNQRSDDLHILPQCSANEEPCNPVAAEPEVLGIMGKDIKEEQNRLKGVEDTLDSWDRGRLMTDTVLENNARVEDATTDHEQEAVEWKQQVTDSSTVLLEDRGKLSELVEESTTSADKTRSWLRDNIATAFDQEKLSEDPSCPKIEELLGQVEVLWELLRRREGRPGTSSDKPAEKKEEKEEEGEEEVELGLEGEECSKGSAQAKVPPGNVGECDSGMLTKFLEHLEQKDSHGMWQVVHGPSGGQQPNCFSVTARETLEVRVDLGKTGSERKQPLAHDQATEHLMNLLSTLMLRINEHLSRCAELSMDILDLESDMAVLCDPDLTGLESLQEQQDDLEVDFHIMEGEVEDMEKLATHLQGHAPEQALLLGEEVQATLQAWEEVGRSQAENRGRLSKFRHLQEFFEKYLAMIAWAETTRSCVFSSGSVKQGRDEEGSVMSELDLRIQQKMEEFSQLTSSGQTLTDDGHHLSEIIRERTDELQSMLGWIQDNWRSQKDQLNQRKRAPGLAEGSGDAHLAPGNKTASLRPSETQRVVENLAPQAQPISDKEPVNQPSGPEHKHTGSVSSSLSVTSAPRVATAPINPGSASVTSVSSVVVDDPGKVTRSLGNSICLILSFDEEERGISQVQKPTEPPAEDSPEATHRVSTFLHVTDSSKMPEKICQDVSAAGTNEEECLPSLPPSSSFCSSSSSSSSSSSTSSSSSSSSPSSPYSPSVPAVTSVFIPTLSKMAAVPSCLGEKITKPGKHQRRSSTLGIAGLDDSARATAAGRPGSASYRTDTWPLGRRKQRCSPTNTELQVYVKPNPLLLNSVQTGRSVADASGHGHLHSDSQQTPAESTSGKIKSQCCYLSMGSTLSFNLPKDLGQLASAPVLNVCEERKASEVHAEISAVGFECDTRASHQQPEIMAVGFECDTRASHQQPEISAVGFECDTQASHQKPRPTTLPAIHQEPQRVPCASHQEPLQQPRPTTLPAIHQEPQRVPCVSHQEPARVPSASKQKQFILSPVEEAKHEAPWDQGPEEDHLSDTVPDPSQSSTRNSINTVSSSATVSSHHNQEPRTTDLSSAESTIALTASSFRGEDEDVVQEMEAKANDEDSASKASVHLPEKRPCCAAVSENHIFAVEAMGRLHKCLSVHTKIVDLNGHIYHRPKEVNLGKSSDRVSEGECKSSMSGRLSARKTSRIVVCADANCSVCSDTPVSRTTASSKEINSRARGNRMDSIQPGRWEFEEEEEELKGIWDGKGNHGNRQGVQAHRIPPVGTKGKTRRTLPLQKLGEPLIQCPPLHSAVQQAHEGCDVFACEEELPPSVSTQHQAPRGPGLSGPGGVCSLELGENALSLKSKSESSSRSVHDLFVNTKKEPVAFTLTLQGGPSGYTAVHPSDEPLGLKRPGRTEEHTDLRLPQVMQSTFSITSAN